MLHARPAVELQVLLDLRLPPSMRWLVDGELDAPLPILHHLRHQGAVLRADVLVVEVDKLRKAHDALVEADPFLHLALFHVGDDVINGDQSGGMEGAWAVAVRLDGLVAGGKDAFVAVAVDKAMSRVAVGANGSELVDAVLVFLAGGRRDADGSARSRHLIGP